MGAVRYLCDQGVRELRAERAFDGTKKCKVIDIRLSKTPRAQDCQRPDVFIPKYGPASLHSIPTDLLAWAQNEASYLEAVSHTHEGRLLVAYHVWDECKKKSLPFPDACYFERFLSTLGLSQSFTWDFARKTAIPLLKEEKDDAYRKSLARIDAVLLMGLDLTRQTPHFEETTLSMTMSYSPETKTTIAFIALSSGEMEEFINTLCGLASLCKSALFLPTLVYWTVASLFSKRMQNTQSKLRDVEIHNGKLKHIHRGKQASKDRDSDHDHIVLVEAHYELTRGLAEFVENLEKRLCKLSRSLEGVGQIASNAFLAEERWPRASSTMVVSIASRSMASEIASEGDPDNLPISGHGLTNEHKELNQLIRRIHYFVQEDLLRRKRLERRVEVQMQVLYNLKQTRIAEATYTDSAAMKSLALLTMIFLPPNAVATIFGANNFCTTQDGTVNGVTKTFSTVFIPTSIVVVTIVAVSWVLYTYWYDMKDRVRGRQRRRQRDTNWDLEAQKCDGGLCEPPRTHRHRKRYDIETGSDFDRSEPIRLWPMHSITSSNSSTKGGNWVRSG